MSDLDSLFKVKGSSKTKHKRVVNMDALSRKLEGKTKKQVWQAKRYSLNKLNVNASNDKAVKPHSGYGFRKLVVI